MSRRTAVLVGASTSTVAAHAFFSRRPLMTVLVGKTRSQDRVPVAYQRLIFPAFGAVVGGVAYDLARGGRPWSVVRLILSTGFLAVTRLQGRHGLSGHVVFAAATLSAFGMHRIEGTLAAAALFASAPFKLRWRDGRGLLLSCAVGAALGRGFRPAR